MGSKVREAARGFCINNQHHHVVETAEGIYGPIAVGARPNACSLEAFQAGARWLLEEARRKKWHVRVTDETRVLPVIVGEKFCVDLSDLEALFEEKGDERN